MAPTLPCTSCILPRRLAAAQRTQHKHCRVGVSSPAVVRPHLLTVRNARLRPHRCPVCSGLRPCRCNSLAALQPGLAAQWDVQANAPLAPQSVTLGSNKRVQWVCSAHTPPHRWMASIYSRSRAEGTGCPLCATQSRRGRRQGEALPRCETLAAKDSWCL